MNATQRNATQTWNDKYAWKNHFGDGLTSRCTRNNPFAGVHPSGLQFIARTQAFQRKNSLDVDGAFGDESLAKYLEVYGEPDLCVHGLDISGWQREDDHEDEGIGDLDEIHFAKLQEQGFSFVWIKLLQGVGRVTKRAKLHIANARSTGMKHGSYHYVTPMTNGRMDAREEAERFMDLIEQECPDHDLLPALDLEDKAYKVKHGEIKRGKLMYGYWKNDRAKYIRLMTGWCEVYLERFKALYGKLPALYSYPSFLSGRIDVTDMIASCPLWLAAYTPVRPSVDPRQYYDIDPRFDMIAQQWTSDGDERSREVFNKSLDLNRATRGLGPLLR